MKSEKKHIPGRAFVSWLVLGLLLVASMPSEGAYKVAVLVQQNPVDGGIVDPQPGVHKVDIGTYVTLKADPQPGYEFVCWLGEVSDSTSNVTTAYVDSPKIIIAVFERRQYEPSIAAAEAFLSASPGAGGTGLIPSSGDVTAPLSGGGGGGRRAKRYPPPSYPEYEPDDFPVPGEGISDDFPVPADVPEPATIMLMSIGSGILLSMRARNRQR